MSRYGLSHHMGDNVSGSRIAFPLQDVVTQVEILAGTRPTSSKSRSTSDDQPSTAPATRPTSSARKVSSREKENERLSQKLNEVGFLSISIFVVMFLNNIFPKRVTPEFRMFWVVQASPMGTNKKSFYCTNLL